VSSRRPNRLVVLAVGAIIVATGLEIAPVGVASDRALPPRVGPIYVVPTGNGTAIRVWRTADGYCILAFRPELIDRAFCVSKASLDRGGPMFSCLCMQRHGTSLVVGTVKPLVRRGEKTDRTGTSAVPLYRMPAALGTNLRVFRAVVRSGTPPKWRVQFYDRSDKVVGTVSQGFKP